MRLYRYVGPPAPQAVAPAYPAGEWIGNRHHFDTWVSALSGADLDGPFTYVVDHAARLLLAPPGTEHVACAGGRRVRAAGEVTFGWTPDGWHVTTISNLSAGYCPDVTSWRAVAAALDRAGLARPDRFTHAVTYRRCAGCAEINVVQAGHLTCMFCADPLPAHWNVDEDEPAGDLLAWCVVANVADRVPFGPGGLQTRRGLKHFSAGAKVWIVPPQWGDGGERLWVVGRHRASKRFIAVVVASRWLRNFRVRGVYSPTVHRLLSESPWNARAALWPDRESADRFCTARNRSGDP